MGVWNETDGLTQLPIQEGRTKIILLLPAKLSFWGGDDKVSLKTAGDLSPDCGPISLSITGDYNEYGSLDNIQEDANSKYVEGLFQALADDKRLLKTRHAKEVAQYFPPDDNFGVESIINEICQNHYVFANYPDKILSDFEKLKQQESDDSFKEKLASRNLEAITAYFELQEGKRLSDERVANLKDPEFLKTQQTRLPFGLFFVLDTFYRTAVETMRNVTLEQAEGYGAHCVNVDYHKKCLKRPKNILSAMKRAIKKGKLDYHDLGHENYEFLSVFGGFKGGFGFSANPHYALDSGHFYYKYCIDAIKEGKPEIAKKTLDDIMDFRLFTTFMRLARKPWMAYDKWTGCQDHEFYLHKALAKATVEYCEKLEKAYQESGRLEDVGR